jgi:hypothetical protein
MLRTVFYGTCRECLSAGAKSVPAGGRGT